MKMNRKRLAAVMAAIGALGMAGCAALTPEPTPTAFQGHQAMQIESVTFGTVVSVQPVTIRYTGQGEEVGGATGAAAGAGIGALLGHGLGAIVGGVVGAGGGALIGGHADTTKGETVVVRLQNHNAIAVTQPVPPKLVPGEGVEVISTSKSTRVLPVVAAQAMKKAGAGQ